jgi:hypothetical protein
MRGTAEQVSRAGRRVETDGNENSQRGCLFEQVGGRPKISLELQDAARIRSDDRRSGCRMAGASARASRTVRRLV